MGLFMTAAKCGGITTEPQHSGGAVGSIMRWALVRWRSRHIRKRVTLLLQSLLEQAQLFPEGQDFLLLHCQRLVEGGNCVFLEGKLRLQFLQ